MTAAARRIWRSPFGPAVALVLVLGIGPLLVAASLPVLAWTLAVVLQGGTQ